MDICTCYHSMIGYQPIRPLSEQITAEQDEQIRKNFASVKPMNEEPLAVKERTPAIVTDRPSAPSKVISVIYEHERPYYTGHSRIDNAIVGALNGKSLELKDNVYSIIRQDFLPNNVHGLSEDDRKALISLGVEKAKYLADQFMNDHEKSSFMDAIRSIARIGMAGRRVGTCDMEYDVKFAVCIDGNGYVHDDIMDELLYTMERDAPEDFEIYKKKSGSDAVWFALHWLMNGNWSLLNSNKTEYKRHKDEQYKKLDEVKLDTTFSGADTSGKKTFLASLVEKLQANQALQTRFFLEKITKMTKTSDGYLMGRQRSLSARA